MGYGGTIRIPWPPHRDFVILHIIIFIYAKINAHSTDLRGSIYTLTKCNTGYVIQVVNFFNGLFEIIFLFFM
jgi:hypothetical protein